jgi:hypothetical protein
MPYTIREIEQLANVNNHDIKFDGYSYHWFSRIDGKWSLHCIKPFKTHLKALSYIKYWLFKYSQEVANNDAMFERITNNVMNDVRIYDIVNSNIKTIDKVVAILDIKPYLNQTDISEYLGISRMAISKHFKNIKYA